MLWSKHGQKAAARLNHCLNHCPSGCPSPSLPYKLCPRVILLDTFSPSVINPSQTSSTLIHKMNMMLKASRAAR